MPVTVTKYASAFASVAGAGPDWSSVGAEAFDGTLHVFGGEHETGVRATDTNGATKVDDLELTVGSFNVPSNATDIKARVRVWMNVNTQGQTPDDTPNTIAWRLTANGTTVLATGLSGIAFPLIVEATTTVVHDAAAEFGTINGISADPEDPDYYFKEVFNNVTNIGRLNDAALRVRVIPPAAGAPLATIESVGVFPIALDVAQVEVTVVYSAVPFDVLDPIVIGAPDQTSVQLGWSANPDGAQPTGHTLVAATSQDNYDNAIWAVTSEGSDTSGTLTGLTPGTHYFVGILGYNGDGTGTPTVAIEIDTESAGGSGAGTRQAVIVARMMSLALGEDLTSAEEGLI